MRVRSSSRSRHSLLAAPAYAEPGTIAVGVGAVPADQLEAAVESATGGRLVEDLGPLDALVFSVPDAEAAEAAVEALPGVVYAEQLRKGERRLAVRPERPALRPTSGTCPRSARSTTGLAPPVHPADPRRGHRLRRRRRPSGARRPDRRLEELRRQARRSPTSSATGRSSPARSRPRSTTRRASPARSPTVELLVAKVVAPDGSISIDDEARGDPLGGRPGRAGHQPEPRRAPEPAPRGASTRTRRSSTTRSTTRRGTASWSSLRAGTARTPSARSPTRTGRRRSRT